MSYQVYDSRAGTEDQSKDLTIYLFYTIIGRYSKRVQNRNQYDEKKSHIKSSVC